MIRYLRLFGYFVQFSVSKSLEFRLDFWFRIVMDCIYYGVNIAFFSLIYRYTGRLGGWTEPQARVFIGGFLLVDAIQMTLFSNNAWMIPIFINRGDLDYYLLRPVNSLFFLSLRDFAVNSFVNVIISIGILVYAISTFPEPLSWSRILLFIVLILNGAYISHLLRVLTLVPIFWTHSARGLEQLHFSVSRAAERPDRIFRGAVRKLFVYVLPFAIIASYPTRLLIEPFDWKILAATIGLSVALTVIVSGLWSLGLRSYSSASS